MRTIILLSIAGLFLLCGCSAIPLDLSLKKNLGILDKSKASPLQVSLGVDNFVDMRPQIHGSDNMKWKGWIPGVMWIDIDSDIPEIYSAFSPFNSRPLNYNIAEAIANAALQSGLYKRVVFLPHEPYQETDYRMEGTLLRSLVQERGYYYGSCVYVWMARVFGFPYVSYKVKLDLNLRLRCMATNEVIWEGKISNDREDRYNNVFKLSRGEDGKHLIAYNLSELLFDYLPDILSQISNTIEQEKTSPVAQTETNRP